MKRKTTNKGGIKAKMREEKEMKKREYKKLFDACCTYENILYTVNILGRFIYKRKQEQHPEGAHIVFIFLLFLIF